MCSGSNSAHSLRKTRAKLSAPGGIRVLNHPLLAALQLLLFRNVERKPPSRTAVYTCNFLTPCFRLPKWISSRRSRSPAGEIEASSRRVYRISTLHMHVMPRLSPSGRATQQPSVGTAEPPHFCVFLSPACPPGSLEPS